MAGAHQLLHAFLDQCGIGSNAELRLFCEGGRLKASMFADLGPLMAETMPRGSNGGYVSPSRARRRERRAAEKAAAEKCAAEKTAAEMCAAEKAAAEKCATEKAAEKCAATASADVASTSCLGSQHQPTPWNTCWTCEGDLSPDHKCDGPAGHISDATCMSPLNPAVVRPSPSAPIVLKKPVKMVDGSPIWTPRTKSNR